jgi:hypothetical protein
MTLPLDSRVHRRLLALALLALVAGCYSEWEEEQRNPPPKVAKQGCPKLVIGGTLVLEPCCTEDNECGGDATAAGFGCEPLSLPRFRAILQNPPPPQTCDGKPLDASVAVPSDGGARDGGRSARDAGTTDAVVDAGNRRDAGRSMQ